MIFQGLYRYSGHGQGKKAGAHFGVGKQASRISIFNRNNPLIEAQIDKVKIPIHSRALLMVNKSFENRYIPLLNHLIDIGYFPDSITTKVINDNIDETITILNEHYNNGYRLFFGTHKSSTFIGLREWFENNNDALYFNSGSRLWINQLDDYIPDNMITTTCNNYRIIKFIFDNVLCNIHQHFDFLLDSPFSNIFDFVDDSLPNGQVFNQIVYISDNADLQIKNNFTDIVKNYININFLNDTQFNDPVTLKTFVLNSNKTNEMPNDLDTLLCENPINGRQFSSSQTKSIFIVDCFNSNNCQSILNYFSKKEYYNNLIIFNDKFLNTLSVPFYSKYNFEYSFILAVNYSELGYKISRQLFGDYNTPLHFIDIFTQILDIFDRAVSSKVSNPTGRLIEYLTNSFSIDRNEWHVKPLYLYGLKERYDETLNRWNFYSSATIFKKSFNDTNTGTASPDESWMDTAISSYPTASGAVSYSTNNTNYKSTVTNTNLDGVSMLFSSLQEITDYTSKLDSFFKGTYKSSSYNGGANPNSTPSVFGIWKCLTNTALPINNTAVNNTIVINVTAPSQALIDGSSTNKNHWFHVYYGPITYNYNIYSSTGQLVTFNSDTVTIDIDLTYSSDNYLVFFNKGNSYNNVRGPLLVYFQMFANQIINKQYRIGDVISINNSSLGTDVNATIDSISSDGFTFGVTRFENENTNGITSTILKQNTGITMLLADGNSAAIMTVNPDITNVSNNVLNLWSGNGCYYLAMLPSGVVVANDYRTGLTFCTLGFDPSAVSLRFRIESPNYLELQLLDSTGAKIKNIIKYDVSANLLVFPLQLTITNDKNIAIVNANNVILWSENTGIYTSLTNNVSMNSSGNYSSLYSLNGIYNLFLSNGVLKFTNVTTNKNIYSISNASATYLKFSYTTNSSTTFALGLYNSSNTQVYNILPDGIYISSTSFDIENNRLVVLSFNAPYTFKITNNGDLVITDTNNSICWKLNKADKTTVAQDCYDLVSGSSTLTSSVITGLSSLHPKQGDLATIHNPTNTLYNNATATIAIVNSDKSIKAVFYDETDTTVRSKIIYEKPDLRSMLITDNGSTSGQNFKPVSNTELFNLTSENGYFSSKIDENGIVRVIDNRTGRQTWQSQSLAIPTGETLFLCNGLILDNNTGSLYISVSTKDENGNIIKDSNGNIIQNNYYIFKSSADSNSSNNNVAYYSLNKQDDGNLCVYQNNNDGSSILLWSSMAWQTDSWSSNSGVIQAFQYDIHSANLVSPNGNYFLAMDYGTLGIMSYNNGSYTWLDSCFKNICKPFFYSGQSGVTAYASESSNTNGALLQVYTSGTLWNNYSNFDGKNDTGGYWSNIYNNVINNFSFSNSDSYNLVDTVSTIWVSSDATYNTKTPAGTYNFYYTYNNTTGKAISAELWVSVVEQCDIYISSVSASKITTLGSSSSSSRNNLYKYDFILQPGLTTFQFLNTKNSGGKCGLAFMCFPKYVSSCDLYFDNTGDSNGFGKGNLLVKNITILAEDKTTVTVDGISNLSNIAITNFKSTGGSGPYTLSFDNDGFEGSSGVLSIINNVGTPIFSSKKGTDLEQNIIVPDDRNGILKAGIKLYAQQDENEMESFLWSPSGYSFFGVQVDTVNKKQNICIFDARFTSPVYSFHSSTYTSLTSADAIAYLMLSNAGAIVAYNNLNSILWQTPNIPGYSNYSLAIDDQNVLRINEKNGDNIVAVATYNQTWGSFENNYLSNWTGSSWGKGVQRVITSANGDYTLVMENGSLNIKSVIDNSYISNSSSNSKDISTTQLYSTLYSYTGTSPSSVYLTFDSDGVLRIHDSTSVLYSFGTSNQGIPNYKMVLSNTGELAVYDCSIPRAVATDIGGISNCPNWSTVYNKFKGNTSSYAWNNYRWLWNVSNAYSSAPVGTVNFYTTYTNTGTTDIQATLWCSVDDTLTIYMNGTPLPKTATEWNTLFSNTITLKAGTTNFFKFTAYNGKNGAGLIFWCLDNNNTNDATNTLFFSNPDTVYCSDGIVMNTDEFGIQTWSSGTSYWETVPYSNYSIDTSDIPENQIVSNENCFKIPSSSDDAEEYTKIYSQNRLYYLRLEIDGTLSIYLSSSHKKIWSNRRPYSGPNNAAKIGFNNGYFGLWDSKGNSYGNTIPVTNSVIYVFYLGNDRILRLVGSDGSSTVFNP
jgi:hypothetical protein